MKPFNYPLNYPMNTHDNYHAHVYFEQETVEFANTLCLTAAELFTLEMGRMHQKPIGPHPKWSCQLAFSSNDFAQLIPWLDKNRQQLSVLVHAVTGDNLRDHTELAYWLGDEVALNLTMFRS